MRRSPSVARTLFARDEEQPQHRPRRRSWPDRAPLKKLPGPENGFGLGEQSWMGEVKIAVKLYDFARFSQCRKVAPSPTSSSFEPVHVDLFQQGFPRPAEFLES